MNLQLGSSWLLFRLVTCRILMIAYSVWLAIECASLFNDQLVYLNLAFSLLIALDGLLVVKLRNGLEDRWCSLSILFFVCGTSIPFWLLEITSSVILAKSVFLPDRSSQLEVHAGRELAAANPVRPMGGENESLSYGWLESVPKTRLMNMLGKHEALFSSVLIVSRIFMPQAALTWSEISNQSEFAFNTIFDIYSTLSLLRDPRTNLSSTIWIMTFFVCNCALYPIALNVFPHDHDDDDANEDDELYFSNRPLSSHQRFRHLTDSPYFRLGMQVALADFPFLILRLIMLANLRYVRREMYYLIAKQFIIIVCKLGIMAYNWCRRFLHRLAIDEIRRINYSSGIEWKIK